MFLAGRSIAVPFPPIEEGKNLVRATREERALADEAATLARLRRALAEPAAAIERFARAQREGRREARLPGTWRGFLRPVAAALNEMAATLETRLRGSGPSWIGLRCKLAVTTPLPFWS